NREDLVGKSSFDLIAPEDQQKAVAGMEEALEKGYAKDLGYLITKDGSKLPVEMSVAIMKGVDGEPIGFVGITTDITERKRAEEAMRESEEKHRVLIETTDTGYLILDAQGRVIDANKEYIRLTGYDTLEEILGRSVVEWTAPYDLERNAAELKKCVEQGYVRNLEIGYVNRSEQITPIEINATVVGSGDSVRILSLCRDISERKRAEEALRTSEAQLSNAMMIAKLGYWEYDVDDDLFIFNDHFYNIFRTNAKKVGGYKMSPERYAKQFVHPDDIPIVGNETRKAIETTDPNFNRQIEHRIIYADGEIGYISVRFFIVKDSHGRTVKTYGANQDITERKKMEDELKDSEIRYHNLFENSSEFIYTLDLKGNFTDVNKAALALTGYTKSELLKMNFKDYTPKRDHSKLFLTFSNIYKTGKPLQNLLIEAIMKDKSKKYFETSISLMKKGEQIIGFQGSSKD
ncbi:MAG: PAS domain-containing protein, partial [Syntrophales bacterium]|nr:PAS domain-containing protein [Syntrophales bacterium]